MSRDGDARLLLWQPRRPEATQMQAFRDLVNSKHGVCLSSYDDLYRWSVQEMQLFWSDFWSFAAIIASRSYKQVLEQGKRFDQVPKWFIGSRLNYTENLLEQRRSSDTDVAVIACCESHVAPGISFAELRTSVKRYATALRAAGVQPGDRVVGLLPNRIETLFAYLACVAVGAVWSCASPDFGSVAVLQRFSQISPILMFAVAAVVSNGKTFDQIDKLEQLVDQIPGLKKIVMIDAQVASVVAKRDAFCAKHRKLVSTLDSFLSVVESDEESFEYTQVLSRQERLSRWLTRVPLAAGTLRSSHVHSLLLWNNWTAKVHGALTWRHFDSASEGTHAPW